MHSRTSEPDAFRRSDGTDWFYRIGGAARSLRASDRCWRLELLDGPNMSNLGPGGRDPRTYGTVASLEALQLATQAFAAGMGCELAAFQSNFEGALIGRIYETAETTDAYVINPAASTRRGVPLMQAFRDVGRPCVEVHFANVAALGWLQGAAISRQMTGVVMGMRHYSYLAAVLGLVCALDDPDVAATLSPSRRIV
jgi:3-dehydroquinate dehydratase-2